MDNNLTPIRFPAGREDARYGRFLYTTADDYDQLH